MAIVFNFKNGVPQGFGLGPIIFTISMLSPYQIICPYGLSFYSYADNPQLLHPCTHLPLLFLVNSQNEFKTCYLTSFNLLKHQSAHFLGANFLLWKVDRYSIDFS